MKTNIKQIQIVDYVKHSRSILMVLATVFAANSAMAENANYLGGGGGSLACTNEAVGPTTVNVSAAWCQNVAASSAGSCNASKAILKSDGGYTNGLLAQNGSCSYSASCATGYVGSNLTTATPCCTAGTSTVTLAKIVNSATTTVDTVTATYDAAMPNKNTSNASLTMPTKTNAVYQGYYDTSAATGGTMYYTESLGSARTWNKTGAQTLYARFADCAYTLGSNVASASVTGVTSNKCQYTYTCSTGYNTGTKNSYTGTYQGGAAIASTKSPNCSIETYTITYNLKNCPNAATASGSETSYTITTDTITLKTPTCSGYTFSGWYTDASLADSQVTSIPKGSTGDKVFYAKWTKTIAYDTKGGSAVSGGDTTCLFNANFALPNTPTKSGYTFAGWVLDQQ